MNSKCAITNSKHCREKKKYGRVRKKNSDIYAELQSLRANGRVMGKYSRAEKVYASSSE